MVTKLGRVVTFHEELPLIELHDPSMTCFVRSRDKLNATYLHLPNLTRSGGLPGPKATTYDKVVTYREGLPLIN